MPFGPEVSWPYGFRQLDPESREVLESAYGTRQAYQQPAMDDFGYGDPGYSDPSYEGPKTPYGNPAFPAGHGADHGVGHAGTQRDFGGTGYRPSGSSGSLPGYQVPEIRDPAAVPSGVRLPGAWLRRLRLSAAVVRAAARQRPGHLAGDRRSGGAARHRPAAGTSR